jgi:hypothetical protein
MLCLLCLEFGARDLQLCAAIEEGFFGVVLRDGDGAAGRETGATCFPLAASGRIKKSLTEF